MAKKQGYILWQGIAMYRAYFGRYNLGLCGRNLGTGKNRSIGESCLGKATMQCDQQKPTIAITKFYSGVIQRVECLTVNQDVAGAEPATRARL